VKHPCLHSVAQVLRVRDRILLLRSIIYPLLLAVRTHLRGFLLFWIIIIVEIVSKKIVSNWNPYPSKWENAAPPPSPRKAKNDNPQTAQPPVANPRNNPPPAITFNFPLDRSIEILFTNKTMFTPVSNAIMISKVN